MFKTKVLVIALGAAFALPAMAEEAAAPASGFTPSSNVSIVSNYLYRGMAQTNGGTAIQGGFDLAHSSGAYAGVWASSISWLATSGSTGGEFDTYAGYKTAVSDVGVDVGFLRYNYPGSYASGFVSADTDEVYGAVSYSIVTAKLSYSTSNLFGVANSKNSTYLELNANYPIADTGITVGGHYGKQTVANNSASDYTDYKLSVSKDFSGYVLGLAYSSTNVASTNGLGVSTGVVSLSRAF